VPEEDVGPPDQEFLVALDVDHDPFERLAAIARERLSTGHSREEVVRALRTVQGEDPVPVLEVLDRVLG
jgi:hypothetical protein